MNDNDSRIVRIENKIDKVVEHIGSIDVTLSAQHVSLAEHIRRTNALEAKVQPIEKHAAMVSGALKLIGMMSVIATIAMGIVEVLNYIKR